jgi:hypothetical protein
MPIGFHWFEFVPLMLLWDIPLIIGFTYVRADANRRGQPGWLWGYWRFHLAGRRSWPM